MHFSYIGNFQTQLNSQSSTEGNYILTSSFQFSLYNVLNSQSFSTMHYENQEDKSRQSLLRNAIRNNIARNILITSEIGLRIARAPLGTHTNTQHRIPSQVTSHQNFEIIEIMKILHVLHSDNVRTAVQVCQHRQSQWNLERTKFAPQCRILGNNLTWCLDSNFTFILPHRYNEIPANAFKVNSS